ncbi:hypothetical protein N0B31_05120 [Salinirubellus salinus]|uniref:Uncharacterized protein n=1 Tax=Salinirubellus salinus TaxID=1364945 RepID=A0A9E7U977_9EURY|nr:hypothetical protein [Salinirubellus salinus]UWM55666.1 hypothetical protein N0B31_05120 [Salinirubellus salinus]
MVNAYTLLTALATLVVGYMGVRQLRDPEWAAQQSASFSADRRGEAVDPDEVAPKDDAVARARTGAKVMLGVAAFFGLLTLLQVIGTVG